jgi:hypothetical protein
MNSSSYPIAMALALLVAGCGGAGGEPSLDQIRKAAERFRDVKVAIAEGYTTDNKCVTAETLGHPSEHGAMGLHYVRRDLLGLPPKPVPGQKVSGTGTYTDFSKPAMLVYEPQADGSLELVGVENLVFASAWHANTGEEPPKYRGTPFVLLKDNPATKLDEAHGWEPHYELHAWVFRDNPVGMHAQVNPTVSCRYHKPPPAAQAAQDPNGHAATG